MFKFLQLQNNNSYRNYPTTIFKFNKPRSKTNKHLLSHKRLGNNNLYNLNASAFVIGSLASATRWAKFKMAVPR
ncbi:hypothetical protein GCM10019815_14950 [Pediococcus damnosus]|nr:hypothetical protein PDA01_09380 [Pediococcus damnosus]